MQTYKVVKTKVDTSKLTPEQLARLESLKELDELTKLSGSVATSLPVEKTDSEDE